MRHDDAEDHGFELVDEFIGIRLGVDLADAKFGEVTIVETDRRVEPEKSFSYVRALWLLRLADGRCIASVPPGAGPAVAAALRGADLSERPFDTTVAGRLRGCVDQCRYDAGLPGTDRVFLDEALACNRAILVCHHHGDCRQLTNADIPAAEGLALPEYCFPDGLVYGIIEDGQVVSVAYAHRTGLMEDRIADIGVETAAQCRRRGFAKTVVSTVFSHIARSGGEGYYCCSTENAASTATARSVGCLPYGLSLILSAPVCQAAD